MEKDLWTTLHSPRIQKRVELWPGVEEISGRRREGRKKRTGGGRGGGKKSDLLSDFGLTLSDTPPRKKRFRFDFDGDFITDTEVGGVMDILAGRRRRFFLPASGRPSLCCCDQW